MEPNEKALQLLTYIGNELKLLWPQMGAWQELFDIEQEKRARLLAETAPGFFAIVQVSLAESILMRIFRLMDPDKTCGNENAAWQNFRSALSCVPHSPLCAAVDAMLADWKSPGNGIAGKTGRYAQLKRLRNKWLAHNDQKQRAEQLTDSLWLPLTHDDFECAQLLAGRMWKLFRQANMVLLGTDVVEPTHGSLDDRPAMVLKCLCASRYVDSLPDDAGHLAATLQALEATNMGADRIRDIFVIDAQR